MGPRSTLIVTYRYVLFHGYFPTAPAVYEYNYYALGIPPPSDDVAVRWSWSYH